MAYTSCAARIAANIAPNCDKPLVGGYTGQAVIISANDFARANVVVDASNPRRIMSIELPIDGSVMAYAIDNVFTTPFTGSTTTGNADDGRNGYVKTLSVRVPMRGADVSKNIIEPLVKNADGFVVIAAKRDKVGDGSFEVFGYQNAMRGDIASVTRDESANGGDWLVNLTTTERWAEVTLIGGEDTYASAKEVFDYLINYKPSVIRYSASDIVRVKVIADGDIIVYKGNTLWDTGNGELEIETDSNDAQYKIYGNVTELYGNYGTADSSALVSLDVSECPSVNIVDLSINNTLEYLNIQNGGISQLTMPSNGATAGTYSLDTLAIAGLPFRTQTTLRNWIVSNESYLNGNVKVYYDATQVSFKEYVEQNTSLVWDWYLVTD